MTSSPTSVVSSLKLNANACVAGTERPPWEEAATTTAAAREGGGVGDERAAGVALDAEAEAGADYV